MVGVFGRRPNPFGGTGVDEFAVIPWTTWQKAYGADGFRIFGIVHRNVTIDRIEAICKRTAGGGGELTKLIGTSAWFAPGAAAAEMVECILKDKKKIHPCSVFLQGEYGVKDQFVGVPVKLGAKGVEEIVQITLTADEQALLDKSAAAVKSLTDIIGV